MSFEGVARKLVLASMVPWAQTLIPLGLINYSNNLLEKFQKVVQKAKIVLEKTVDNRVLLAK